MIIAIDGPAGSGKSTIAKIIAETLRFRYINTGAMYRAVAWHAQELGVDLNNTAGIGRVAAEIKIDFVPDPQGQRILVGGIDVTRTLKSETVGTGAAIVASQPQVREAMTAKQREMGKSGDVVMEGRDIGSVVFPQADRKFYIDADPEERGRRRYRELKGKHADVDLATIIEQIRQRDHEDANRKIAPLIRATDAIYVNTTQMKIEEVVTLALRHIDPGAGRE